MYSCYMPVGKPTYFKGNIEAVWEPTQDALDKHKKDPNYELRPYGFFKCKVKVPHNLNHPILQRKVLTINGFKTLAGIGDYTGWLY